MRRVVEDDIAGNSYATRRGSVRIVLPATVVSELDGLQYASDGELAYRARSALSMLEGCVGGGNLRWLRRERAAQGKGAGMPYLVAGDRKGEWVQGVAQETKPAADSMWWDKDRDGDKEVLGLCLALRAPAAAKTQKGSTRWGALGVVGGGERGEVGEKHGRAPTRVVLLTADKALQVSAMLEGVRTMAIEQWASREVQ